uniref:Quinone oxidoreductase PIG3-like n=1 Tax=Phallusia mammillata TaxID=59560 RepID=A0A6F9DWC8_9ASCI|nr:quinone oxidoreductase PIG3-like [Phallusia mammillata]
MFICNKATVPFSFPVRLFFAVHLHRTIVSIEAMKVVKQNKFGGADELYVQDVPEIPQPLPNQVLIKTAATALNRADLLIREGKYPGQKTPQTLGLEVSGVIEATGSNSTKWNNGDKVMALLPGGGYSQFVTVNEDHVMPVPSLLNLQDAAAIPEVWLTAFQLLHFVGKVAPGETVLVHGGGSGVGTAAVQLARLSQAKVFVTAGTEEKISIAKSLGAQDGFNYKDGEFADKVFQANNGKGVNLVLDCVGGSFWTQNLKSLAVDGRWVVFGLLGGGSVDGPLLSQVLAKRISILGTTLKSRSDEYKAKLIKDFTSQALPYFSSGKGNVQLKPVIDSVMDIAEVVEAHLYMASNKNKGKIILKFSDVKGKSEL